MHTYMGRMMVHVTSSAIGNAPPPAALVSLLINSATRRTVNEVSTMCVFTCVCVCLRGGGLVCLCLCGCKCVCVPLYACSFDCVYLCVCLP